MLSRHICAWDYAHFGNVMNSRKHKKVTLPSVHYTPPKTRMIMATNAIGQYRKRNKCSNMENPNSAAFQAPTTPYLLWPDLVRWGCILLFFKNNYNHSFWLAHHTKIETMETYPNKKLYSNWHISNTKSHQTLKPSPNIDISIMIVASR